MFALPAFPKVRIVIGMIAIAIFGAANVCQAVPPPEKKEPTPDLATGLTNPHGVAVWNDRIYVTTQGEIGKSGDGAIWTIGAKKKDLFARGLDDPKGMVGFQQSLFVVDTKGVYRFDKNGRGDLLIPVGKAPGTSQLSDIDVDEKGNLYLTDAGTDDRRGGLFFTQKRGKGYGPTLRIDNAQLRYPAGLVVEGVGHAVIIDGKSGDLLRVNCLKRTATKAASGFGSGGALAYDHFGRLFLTDTKNRKIYGIARPDAEPVERARGYQGLRDICVDHANRRLLFVDAENGRVATLAAVVPNWIVDRTPLDIETTVAFPNLKFTGWDALSPAGKFIPMRPIVLTHAGDGTDRIFIATQRGMIHVIPNDPNAKATKLFLDIRDKVVYRDRMNEEGFLGLAFHPKYKDNGEFFIYYTTENAPHTSLVSRFRVSKDDPNRADPASEEVLMTIKQPFWNHNGGTITFGPDGYLYIALGDGGTANDPMRNGQNLKTWLGSILRIDIDRQENGKKYAIPKDNPFVGKSNARPEIYAYGLRNVWRMGFDKKTGQGWVADVGQNLYEEINLLKRGANYGWNLREGLHPFGATGVGVRKDLIDPIWEYHHNVGKSITGGTVYRGEQFPELVGCYLYSDYVSGKIWALRYDVKKERVVANRSIASETHPWFSFGEDSRGEAYLLTDSGRGIYRFVRKK